MNEENIKRIEQAMADSLSHRLGEKITREREVACVGQMVGTFTLEGGETARFASEEDYLIAVTRADAWRGVALAIGERLAATGPAGYYDFTPEQWREWAVRQIENSGQRPYGDMPTGGDPAEPMPDRDHAEQRQRIDMMMRDILVSCEAISDLMARVIEIEVRRLVDAEVFKIAGYIATITGPQASDAATADRAASDEARRTDRSPTGTLGQSANPVTKTNSIGGDPTEPRADHDERKECSRCGGFGLLSGWQTCSWCNGRGYILDSCGRLPC